MDRRSAAQPAVTLADRAGDEVMTIGELSRRTGVPVKALRRYADMGLIYSAGRSAANYRLFGEPALWCVQVITGLRALGLTVAEISQLAGIYLRAPGQPIGPHLAGRLRDVRARLDERIAGLQDLRRRIEDFETIHAADLASDGFRAQDPLSRSARG
jgi:MerR family copper efflux transcriptional regulator